MKIYDLKEKPITSTYMLGDIHGDFETFQYMVKYRENCLIIVLGDCGLGFYKPQYYQNVFTKFNQFCEENNIYIMMLRGNHDDPSYFSEEKINFSNIKSIPDYSLILTEQNNILCVGGATSVDRTWRITQEVRLNKFRRKSSYQKKLYWNDEAPVLNCDIIPFLNENDIKVNIIASHTRPDWVKINNWSISTWLDVDSKLKEDIENEQKIMTDLHKVLVQNGHPINKWFHGHFHTDYDEVYPEFGITVTCVNEQFQFKSVECERLIEDESPF